MTTVELFNTWLAKPEDTNLEFKSAEGGFSRDKDLPNYCAALANEGGGKLILGVNPDGIIKGSKAFKGTYNTLSNILLQKLGIRVDVEELMHPEGRVLIFHVPLNIPGKPIKSNGIYWMRAGESLTAMDEMILKQKLNEAQSDSSNNIVQGLSVEDLDKNAMQNLQKSWAQKANREEYISFTCEKMLRALGLLSDKGINYAGLILLGRKEKIDEFLPDAEIIFEWRNDVYKIPHDFRVTWREPFFNIYDDIWQNVNVRNLRIPFQQGFIQREIFAFSEKPIREAVLNAVAHRDYTLKGQSIFIKVSPDGFFIESPGGFPPGITIENILYKSQWRNRRIAEVFEKAGLVERSGQGMDDIFSATIKEGKGLPDLSGSSVFSVQLKIPAKVKDKNFILFLEKVINEKQAILPFEAIYELEQIREHQKMSSVEFKEEFLKLGIIEKMGKGRGSKYILSHKYYAISGKAGVHTRLSGITREQKKMLILTHLKKNKKGYRHQFLDVFPDMKPTDISNLLRELKIRGKIEHVGNGKTGYWKLVE